MGRITSNGNGMMDEKQTYANVVTGKVNWMDGGTKEEVMKRVSLESP